MPGKANMDIDKLSKQLVLHEGLRLLPYTDSVGKITIGVGHNLTDNGITSTQAQQLLTDDIQVVVYFLDGKLTWWRSLDDVRQRALADLTFNLMNKVLDFKHMLAALEAGDWEK